MRKSCKEFILFYLSVFKKYVIFSQSNVLNNQVKPNKKEMFKHYLHE